MVYLLFNGRILGRKPSVREDSVVRKDLTAQPTKETNEKQKPASLLELKSKFLNNNLLFGWKTHTSSAHSQHYVTIAFGIRRILPRNKYSCGM